MKKGLSISLLTAILSIFPVYQTALAGNEDVGLSKEAEIEFLLTQIGSSGCLFIRNGSEHEPAEAEDHLRMKYRKGRRYISNADDFITRIASKSSWSGKPYQVKCPDEPAHNSGAWLSAALEQYRSPDQP